jgi:hypothetical protein
MRMLFYVIAVVCLCCSNLFTQIPAGYKGSPFHNDSVKVYPIRIPGKLQCEYYDFGGLGVAYGGTKAKINGLNPGADLNYKQHCNEGGNTYLCTFRDTEAVAVSYTKPCCDYDAVKNMYPQILKQLYAGWTSPGQWLNYTVHVDTPGVYLINFLHTASLIQGLEFSLALNDSIVVNKEKVPNSFHSDMTDTQKWHRWNKLMSFAEIAFPDTGLQLLTFRVTYVDPAEKGDMGNFDYIEFVRKSPVSVGMSKRNILKPNGLIHRSYPNPFNSETSIVYDLTRGAVVTVEIYNNLGQRIKELEVGNYHPIGEYRIKWNGTDRKNNTLPSGIYYYSIKVNNEIYSDKIQLLK